MRWGRRYDIVIPAMMKEDLGSVSISYCHGLVSELRRAALKVFLPSVFRTFFFEMNIFSRFETMQRRTDWPTLLRDWLLTVNMVQTAPKTACAAPLWAGGLISSWRSVLRCINEKRLSSTLESDWIIHSSTRSRCSCIPNSDTKKNSEILHVENVYWI